MGQTREQRIIKQLSGTSGTSQIQKFTPIATEMFLPNHSGIASHPEAVGTFVKKSGDTMTGRLNINNTLTGVNNVALNVTSTNPDESTVWVSGNQTGRGTLKITHNGVTGDEDSAALSIALEGTTAAHGLFVDCGASQGSNVIRSDATSDAFLVEKTDGTDLFRVGANSLVWVRKLIPIGSETYDLGDTTHIWANVYGNTFIAQGNTDGAVLLEFNTARPWSFINRGTDAASSLNLVQTDTSNKTFNIQSGSTTLAAFQAQTTAATLPVLALYPQSTAATNTGLYIDQNNDAYSLYIDSEATTAQGVKIDMASTSYIGLETNADIKAGSFTIGANTLTTSEWAYLDGQDQAVKTSSNVKHNEVGAEWLNGATPTYAKFAKWASSDAYSTIYSNVVMIVYAQSTYAGYFNSSGFSYNDSKGSVFGSAGYQKANSIWGRVTEQRTSGTTPYIQCGALAVADTDYSAPNYIYGRYWLICDASDLSYSFNHGKQTNPTLFIHSAAQSTNEWLSFSHNGTDSEIKTGKGYITTDADIKPTGYRSSDGSQGVGFTTAFNDADGNEHTVEFKNGILVSWVIA